MAFAFQPKGAAPVIIPDLRAFSPGKITSTSTELRTGRGVRYIGGSLPQRNFWVQSDWSSLQIARGVRGASSALLSNVAQRKSSVVRLEVNFSRVSFEQQI